MCNKMHVYLCVCVCVAVQKSLQSYKATDDRGYWGEKRDLGNWSPATSSLICKIWIFTMIIYLHITYAIKSSLFKKPS